MSDQEYQFTNEEVPTGELMIGGGTIRFPPNAAPYLHTNATHHSVGIKSIRIDENGDLEIRRFSGGAVVSVSVTPDETMARLGITPGCSGGGILSKIHFYNRQGDRLDLRKPEHYAQLSGTTPWSNLWVVYINRKA